MEVGFLGLLQIVFITLKVLNIISWSWWIVFIPLYIEIALIAIIFIVYGVNFKIKSAKRVKKMREWQKKIDELRRNR
jgi:amino acid permease